MLAAHLVPGYFAAVLSQPAREPEWNRTRRAILWATALGITVAPDLDVVYNAVFRGFFNHSTLWMHSALIYLGFALVWLLLHMVRRGPYIKILAGLIALGRGSHLLLDVIAHGTPLLYPVSMTVASLAPQRVIEGGVWACLTDPVFLLEPLLFAAVVVHWAHRRQIAARHKSLML